MGCVLVEDICGKKLSINKRIAKLKRKENVSFLFTVYSPLNIFVRINNVGYV